MWLAFMNEHAASLPWSISNPSTGWVAAISSDHCWYQWNHMIPHDGTNLAKASQVTPIPHQAHMMSMVCLSGVQFGATGPACTCTLWVSWIPLAQPFFQCPSPNETHLGPPFCWLKALGMCKMQRGRSSCCRQWTLEDCWSHGLKHQWWWSHEKHLQMISWKG